MTEPTDANAELMKAAVKRSRDQYKLDTSRAAFQAGAIFGSAFRTPQATQPQAGAVPLTKEQAASLCKMGPVYAPNGQVVRTPEQYRRELEGAKLAGIRTAERAHGITGCQHG